MINPNNPSAPLSVSVQAKLDKEKLNSKPIEQNPPDRSPAGIENPAIFGIHNPNFNNKKVYNHVKEMFV